MMHWLAWSSITVTAVLIHSVLIGVVSQATDAYDLAPDWTIEMPLPYSRSIAQAFLDAHNARRAAPPRSAANMRKLVWNATLANLAVRHVRQCTFEHDTQNCTIGQVLELGGRPELNVAKVNATLEAWVERDLATHPLGNDGRMVAMNLASQILWADTISVGCASQWCPNVVRKARGVTGVLTACNYFPPGNYPDRPVLQVGPPCSKCPSDAFRCDKTLCTNEQYTFPSHLAPIDPSIPH